MGQWVIFEPKIDIKLFSLYLSEIVAEDSNSEKKVAVLDFKGIEHFWVENGKNIKISQNLFVIPKVYVLISIQKEVKVTIFYISGCFWIFLSRELTCFIFLVLFFSF